MNETKRLLKNTGIIAIGNLSAKIVTFLLLPLYTSVLSTEEYGTIDYVLTLSMFCVPIISLLMDEAIFRFLIDCKTEEEQIQVISVSIFLVSCGIITSLVIGGSFIWYIHYQYGIYLLLLVFSDLTSTMLSALLRGMGNTEAFSVFNFLSSVLQIILNVLFIAFFHWGIQGMLLGLIFGRFSVSIGYIALMRLWRQFLLKSVSISKIREMIIYSLPLIPNKISWLIINLSSRLVIMNTMGSGYVGLYAISSKFPTMMDTVYGFFYQSWKESSARALQDENHDEFYNYIYQHLTRFMYSLVLIITASMPGVFSVLIAPEYYDAIFYIPILLLATYFANISGFYGGIFTAYKDTKIMGTTTIVGAGINLVLIFIFIYWGGLYAVAMGAVIANFLINEYRRIKVKKYVCLQEHKSIILANLSMTILVFSAFYSMMGYVQVVGFIGAIIYTTILNHTLLKRIFYVLKSRMC